MMIAPVKDATSNVEPISTDDHDINLSVLSTMKKSSSVGTFSIEGNTVLSIQKHTTISVKSNIILNSPVIGQGTLLLNGDRKLSIDAKGNSISNLVIRNSLGVELKSQLEIAQELSVEDGRLYLNDFNLVLNHSFVKINTEDRGDIAFNGSGRIIGQTLQPLSSPAPQNDRDFSSQAFINLLTEQHLNLIGTQITYYMLQNCDSAILCPPVPPPD